MNTSLQWILVFMHEIHGKKMYRRIFVYTFCLINICLSLSDDANERKTLNIERALQFQLPLKL